MTLLYFLSSIALLQGIISLIDGVRASRFMRRQRPHTPIPDRDSAAFVRVFCPCKGVDPEFDGNIRSILDQEYSNFSVQFVVESHDDPAYDALQRLGIQDVVIAGEAVDRGQKIHNLVAAIRQRSHPAADIFVFCDSDGRFSPSWLSRLTAPLADTAVDVTTGYRWYVPSEGLPSLLRSAWNASIVTMLGDHNRNFVWGGSMAMRRETFDRLGVLAAWDGALSDDYAVTRAVERAGGRIVFVPGCLVPTFGVCSWSELLEFTTRQITITRVYHPRMWRIGFVSQTIFLVSFVGLMFASAAYPVARGLWIAIYLLSVAKSWIRLSAVRTILPPALSKSTWFYILSSPVVALLFEYNMLRSALSTKIVWRQKRYNLISPSKTEVLRPGGSGANGV